MLKLKKEGLPPLQPHLTGTNSDVASERSFKLNAVEELRRSRKHEIGRPGIPGLNVRTWAEQAQPITDATQTTGRSAATAAEIQLHEALHKCSLAAGEYSEHTNRPYRLRTAVCCKLLEEFAALAGPFSGILNTLVEEVNAIYSNSFAHQGGSSRMDQLPYYVVASKLETQNSRLLSEQQQFREQLGGQSSMLDEMHSKLQKLASALESANASNQELTISQSSLERREKAAQHELQSAKESLSSAKHLLKQTTSEAAETKVTLEDKVSELEEALETQKDALEMATQAVRTKQEEISQLHTMIQGMVRQSEVHRLEEEVRELTTTVAEQSRELRHQGMELEQLRCRTPRPSWPQLYADMHAAGALSPAEPVDEANVRQASCQLAEQLSNRVTTFAQQLQDSAEETRRMRYLLPPEPSAACAEAAGWLHIPVSCTELGNAVVDACGTKPEVPRILRSDSQVTLCSLSQHDTLQSILHILTNVPESSSTLHGALYNLWLAADVPHTAVPRMGYSLVASLQLHKHNSALIKVMHDIWLGNAPMHALDRMRKLVQGLDKILGTLTKIHLEDSAGPGLLPKADFVQMLHKLCPCKSEDRMKALSASLSLHEDGSCVRVGEIHCSGADCMQIIEKAAFSSPCHDNVPFEAGMARDEEDKSELAADQTADEARAEKNEENAQISVGAHETLAPGAYDDEPSLEPEQSGAGVHDKQGPAVAQDEEATGTCNLTYTLPVLLLQQHAEELEGLRDAVRGAVLECNQGVWPGGNSLAEIQQILECVQNIDTQVVPGCVDAWARLPCPNTRQATAAGLLATAPLQCSQDFDIAAAAAWVDGLQGREDGCESAAMLPEVV